MDLTTADAHDWPCKTKKNGGELMLPFLEKTKIVDTVHACSSKTK
jgi:hypothetical protein